ncbi:MAG: MFS transporter [Victivallales bacterium]|nr:MFS transporter [Victivallales bacterium]
MKTASGFRAFLAEFNKQYSLAVAWMINSLAYSIIYPFIPIYLYQERGFSMNMVGLLFPVMGVGTIIAMPLTGWLTDKVGRYFVIQLGQISRGGVFLLMALSAWMDGPFWSFALLMFFSSIAGSFFQIAADSYLTDITTPEKRPAAYSRIRIGTNVGWAIGPMLGAFLARTPFSLMFLVTATLCLLASVYTGKLCREPASTDASVHLQPNISFSSVFKVVTSPFMLMLLCGFFMLHLLTSQLYSVLSVFATDVVKVSTNTLGFAYSVNGLTIMFLQLPITFLFDRCRTYQISRLITGTLLYMIGYFSLAFCNGGLYLGIAIFIISIGEIAVQPALYTLVSKAASPGTIGRCMAALGIVRGLAFALGPWIGSMVYEYFSYNPLIMWTMLSSSAIMAIFLFLIIRGGKHKE